MRDVTKKSKTTTISGPFRRRDLNLSEQKKRSSDDSYAHTKKVKSFFRFK